MSEVMPSPTLLPIKEDQHSTLTPPGLTSALASDPEWGPEPAPGEDSESSYPCSNTTYTLYHAAPPSIDEQHSTMTPDTLSESALDSDVEPGSDSESCYSCTNTAYIETAEARVRSESLHKRPATSLCARTALTSQCPG